MAPLICANKKSAKLRDGVMRRGLFAGFLFTMLAMVTTFPASPREARAQTSEPQLFITWSANSYAPPGFLGKKLPTTNSQIVASVSVIEKGKVADLGGETIYWYMNGNFVGEGSTVTFRAPGVAPNMFDLRAQFPYFRGGPLLLQTIRIPVVRPELTLEAPYPRGVFRGESARVRAKPYFFGVPSAAELTFSWNVNNQEIFSAEDPQNLTITPAEGISGGGAFSIRAVARWAESLREFAAANLALSFSQ